jgi:hypothetical protein
VIAAALLSRLDALDVSAVADGIALRLRPASAIPPDLMANLRAHKRELLALLAASDHDRWGLTAAARAQALARLNARTLPLRSHRAAGASPAGSQDGPLDPLPPTTAPALLVYIRDCLQCRVTLAGNLIMIAPTWRCPRASWQRR